MTFFVVMEVLLKYSIQMSSLISHITIGSNDIAVSKKFYDAVFQPLGIYLMHEYPDALGYGTMPSVSQSPVWIVKPFDNQEARPGNGWHAAFLAPDQKAVDEFHRAALENDGSCEGKPGLRLQYHPSYYAAYVRDPFGNKIQAVHHGNRSDVIDVI